MTIQKTDIEIWKQSDVTKYFFEVLEDYKQSYINALSDIDPYSPKLEKQAIVLVTSIKLITDIINSKDELSNDTDTTTETD